MTVIVIVAVLVVVWIVIGLVARVPLLRRGHRNMSWVNAAFAGPFVIPIAIEHARWHLEQSPRVVGAGAAGEGPIDTLVGIDPSPAAQRALLGAIDVLGSRIGRLVVATVVPHAFRDPGERQQVEHEAEMLLEQTRRDLERETGDGAGRTPELVVLHGGAADALAEYATGNGMHVIAVGKRGTGLSKSVLGSVASRLARDARGPVLVVGE